MVCWSGFIYFCVGVIYLFFGLFSGWKFIKCDLFVVRFVIFF